jgi:putative ABC transport system substrate-binding protein
MPRAQGQELGWHLHFEDRRRCTAFLHQSAVAQCPLTDPVHFYILHFGSGLAGDRMQSDQLKRREFIALFGAGTAWPLIARAQQPQPMRRIGVLLGIAESDPEGQARVAALHQGLRDLGWVDGRNFRFDIRWIAGETEQMRPFAKELIELKPDLIVAATTPAVTALREATQTVPIVFVQVIDPIGRGFIDNLARPGGNITGFVTFEFSMGGKWLQTLKQAAPRIARVALLFHPQTAPFSESFIGEIEAAARSFGIEMIVMPVRDSADLESAVAAFAAKPDGGLIILPDLFNTNHRDRLVALASRHRLPAVYPFRYFATSGGLISDGVDTGDLYRRSASYVDRILKGAKAGELPIQTPTKFELVINLKTAKTLGLEIAPMLLARADEVIE